MAQDSGEWSWTPEIVIEHDGLPCPLDSVELKRINETLDQQHDMIMARVAQWNAPKTAAPEKPLNLPPVDPSVLKDAPNIKPPEQPKPQAAAPAKIGQDQVTIILDVMKRSKKNVEIVDAFLKETGAVSVEDLTRPQGTKLIDRLYKGGVL
jgi:hypothetical protein